MKKILLVLVLVLLGAQMGYADPRDSIGKLAKSAADSDKNNPPAVVLTTEEEEELVQYIMDRYEQRGLKLTPRQAAIVAGQMAGILSIAMQFQKGAQGAGQGK